MISIIISSYLPHYFSALEKNIAETIGVPYEIIKIDNPGLMGICEAYNQGAKKARFDNLVFLHEDIVFKTPNWGNRLILHLDQENTGLIGIAGSSYVPVAPSSWTVAEKYNFVNILQGNKQNNDSVSIHSTKENRTKVFAVDGVFLAIKKENYTHIRFDEELKGFHGYDLDFSLRVAKKFQNYVIDDILIQHFSQGNRDKKWLDSNIIIKEKIGTNFPHEKNSETEKNIFLSFLYQYFIYYPITSKNILFTLKFFPFKYLTFQDKMLILKKYFNYIRFSSEINKKTQ
ncbi:MAG: glycosyltransferase [Candidatus Chryseobacterium colombiense]|nr:glycosyltransferase [Chryseobacterium sp.]WEK69114.1 MAG: glycosyltransferase [Chryseobacterium sp.]